MQEYWKLLELDGYLEKKESSFPGSSSVVRYTRLFPETPELPEVEVGVGIILHDEQGVYETQVVAVPPFASSSLSKEAFLDLVGEEARRVKAASVSNWQERLLLKLGFAAPRDRGKFNMYHLSLFDILRDEAKETLLEKYGLHKISTMVAHGHTQNLDTLISLIDEVRGDASYRDILRVMALGVVPMEDLHLAAQLPVEMVAELYSRTASKAAR